MNKKISIKYIFYYNILILSHYFIKSENKCQYKCLDKYVKGAQSKDVCYYYNSSESTDTIYIKKCTKGQTCISFSTYNPITLDKAETGDDCSKIIQKINTTSNAMYAIGICKKIKRNKSKGTKCSSSSECFSGHCNGKCYHLPDGESCTNHYECGFKSYCNNNEVPSRCRPLLSPGQLCDNDYQCPFDMACGAISQIDSTRKRCMPIFSLNNNMYSRGNNFCKSNFTNGTFCAEQKVTNDCDNSHFCVVDSNTDNKYKCIMDMKGNENCMPSTSGNAWTNFIKVYQKEIKNVNSDKTHISGKRDVMWGNDKIKIAYNKYRYSADTAGGDSCTVDAYIFMNNSNRLKCYKLIFIVIIVLQIIF